MAELDADCRIVAGTGAFNFATIGPGATNFVTAAA